MKKRAKKKEVKITLHAIGNKNNFNYYIFDKSKKAIIEVAAIIEDIFKTNLDFEQKWVNKKEKVKTVKLNYEKKTDFHISLNGKKNSRIDFFFGQKRFFLSLHCDSKRRVIFNEELAKVSSMNKPKKRKIKGTRIK